MKRQEDDEDPPSAPAPLKRSRQMQLPREIHLVPKVTKLISEFAMSASEAAKEAAATNQIEWLTELLTLPELCDKMAKQLKSSRKSPQFAVIPMF
ncbi:hypothetical protein PC121_g14971 [Phytophthora cactorum]|nr:hypothetical protein PC121_g14971 [Phytophthora cactorum]